MGDISHMIFMHCLSESGGAQMLRVQPGSQPYSLVRGWRSLVGDAAVQERQGKIVRASSLEQLFTAAESRMGMRDIVEQLEQYNPAESSHVQTMLQAVHPQIVNLFDGK